MRTPRREIGIRVALGASPSVIVGIYVRRGVGLAVLGVVVGLAGAVALTRAMASLRFGVGALDPATCATVSVLLAWWRRPPATSPPAGRARRSGQDVTRAVGPIGCRNAR